MTTDKTRDQSGNMTTEALVAKAMRESWSDELEYTDAPEAITAALRAAGLLLKGAPTDEQVDLSELQRLADASTPGPWNYHETIQADNHVTAGGGILTGTHVCGPTYERHNARFIAAAREAIPSLIRRVRELEFDLAAAGVAPPAPTGSGLGPRDHGDRETHNRTDDPAGDKAPHEDAEQGAHDGTECGDDKDTAEAHEVQVSNGVAPPEPSNQGQVEASNQIASIVAEQVERTWPDLHPVLRLRYGIADAVIAAFPDIATRASRTPHIADEAVQKLRGLGLDDSTIREHLAQATLLAAALVPDELVQVVVKITAKATFTSEDLHQIERAGVRVTLPRGPAQVDEAKLAEVIAAAYESDAARLQGVNRHDERAARAVLEYLDSLR